MIIVLMVGAYLFNAFLAITQIPDTFGEFLLNLPVNRWLIMFGSLKFDIP